MRLILQDWFWVVIIIFIIIIIIIIIIMLLLKSCFFFYISVNWWSFIEVWVTASLLKFQELFSVFWPYIYHLFAWSNFIFLHNSQWITLPTQSCLVLYSFCVNLLHSLITWLMVSSLSPHNLHMLFCCILSILALILLVLIALFCAAIRRSSVYLLRFLFLSHVHIFSCEMLLISRLKRP